MLEAKLQDNQKTPKWNLRSRLGKCIGFSDEHSTLVENIRNLRTGYISPQYHLIFDDLFGTTVHTGDNYPVIDNIHNELFDSIRDWYTEEEFKPDGQLIYRPPPLAENFLDERGRRERKEQLGKQGHHQEQCIRDRNKYVPEPEIIPLITKDDTPPIGPSIYDNESSDDYSFVKSPHTESEGGLFEDVAPAAPTTPLLTEEPNIAPEGVTAPPNNSPDGENTHPEGDNSRNNVWNWDKNNLLKRLKLNR